MVFLNNKGGKDQYDLPEDKFNRSPYEPKVNGKLHEEDSQSSVDMIIDKEPKDSLYTDELAVPNENWSQFKRSNEVEAVDSSPRNNAHCDIDTEMIDEEEDSACWNESQS